MQDARTSEWAAELPEAAGGVEGLDGENAAGLVPEHEEPPRAEAVRGGELRSPAAQERAWPVRVPADLDAPDLAADRADHERRAPGAAGAFQCRASSSEMRYTVRERGRGLVSASRSMVEGRS